MLSPSLSYLRRVYTWHGVHFGDFGGGLRQLGRLTRRDYLCLVLQFGFVALSLSNVIYGIVNGPSIPLKFNAGKGNNVMSLMDLVGDIKPGTKFIYSMNLSSYWLCRLTMHWVIIYKGAVVLDTTNNPLYRRFDGETNFRPKFALMTEMFTYIFAAYQMFAIWTSYGFACNLVNLFMATMMLFNSRHHTLSYVLQLYTIQANRFWLRRLASIAERKNNSANTLLECTQQAERLLWHLTNFYRKIAPIVLSEVMAFLGLLLFLGIYLLIRPLSGPMLMMFGGNALFMSTFYVVIFWQHHQLVVRFETLQATLAKQTMRHLWPSAQRSMMHTNLETRVFLLATNVRHQLPPMLCGVLDLRLATLGNLAVFLVHTSITLYQTEYM